MIPHVCKVLLGAQVGKDVEEAPVDDFHLPVEDVPSDYKSPTDLLCGPRRSSAGDWTNRQRPCKGREDPAEPATVVKVGGSDDHGSGTSPRTVAIAPQARSEACI